MNFDEVSDTEKEGNEVVGIGGLHRVGLRHHVRGEGFGSVAA